MACRYIRERSRSNSQQFGKLSIILGLQENNVLLHDKEAEEEVEEEEEEEEKEETSLRDCVYRVHCQWKYLVSCLSYTKKHRGGCTRGLLRPGPLITNRARSVRLVIRG